MDNITQAALIGLPTAAITAITFVAYKHPRAYLRAYPWMCGTFFVTEVGCFIWNFSNVAAQNALIPFILKGTDITPLDSAIKAAGVSSTYLFLGFLLFLYLQFLLSLPKWMFDKD